MSRLPGHACQSRSSRVLLVPSPSRSPALPPFPPLHATPSASACRPRASGAARAGPRAHDRRGTSPGPCTLHSPANVKPARDAGPRGPASAEAEADPPGAAGAPQRARKRGSGVRAGAARHRAGVSTGSCQAPFSGYVTRAIGMPGTVRVSTDSARVRKRREITGINRVNRTRERAAGLVGLAARFTRDRLEKPQVSALISALEQLPRHHHPLDLVGALVDLGDRGPWGSFRS